MAEPTRDSPGERGSSGTSVSLERSAYALLALRVAERLEKLAGDAPKRATKSILFDAGLSFSEIAPLVGKDKEAVRSMVRRVRGRTPGRNAARLSEERSDG